MTYRYESIFGSHIEDYIQLRISNGLKAVSFYYLAVFDKFLIDNDYTDTVISKEIIDKWAIQKETENKNTRISRISQVSQFCKYLLSIGIEAYISNYHFSGSKAVPYVMTYEEIQLLFTSIDKYCCDKKYGVKHYKYMLPVFFRILYTSGLRNNEACCLKLSDVLHDFKAIHIKAAKNNKDRIVYLTDDVYELLHSYICRIMSEVQSVWLFPSSIPEKHIRKTTVERYFDTIRNSCGLGCPNRHPVPHSLRHTYVVHRVDSWVKEGKDLNSMMPYISKQLGHSSIEFTFYYYHTLVSSFDVIKEKDRNIYPEAVYEE